MSVCLRDHAPRTKGCVTTMSNDREHHWNTVYRDKPETQLSWHQDDPSSSLDLMAMMPDDPDAAIIDIGGGTSRLAARLLDLGVRDVSVLDISSEALAAAQRTLGAASDRITWIAADITLWKPERRYDLWHDRAVFHFLTDASDRAAYLDALSRALGPGGHAMISTFALDGPETCSGLPVTRYSPQTLLDALGSGYDLVTCRDHRHLTPWGSPQPFQVSLFRKRP